jgi:hypothetical protein
MTFKFPVPQYLRQQGAMGCGVSVFAELTGLSRAEILHDRPQGEEDGLTVREWEEYLSTKRCFVRQYRPDEPYPLPCAHLVHAGGGCHWIFQDERGVFDPSPSFQYMPADDPRMLNFSVYVARILTIAVTRSPDKSTVHR